MRSVFRKDFNGAFGFYRQVFLRMQMYLSTSEASDLAHDWLMMLSHTIYMLLDNNIEQVPLSLYRVRVPPELLVFGYATLMEHLCDQYLKFSQT